MNSQSDTVTVLIRLLPVVLDCTGGCQQEDDKMADIAIPKDVEQAFQTTSGECAGLAILFFLCNDAIQTKSHGVALPGNASVRRRFCDRLSRA